MATKPTADHRGQPESITLSDVSDAAQDYLREIYTLQDQEQRVTTSSLARRMGVAPPSATAMIKRLAQLGLAEHVPYRGVRLTPAGERIALELLRHHRLLELYLANVFDFGIDAVHAEADRLEHVLSEALEARIDESLGSPTHDPHGDPIPDGMLRVEPSSLRALTTLDVGDEANVARVPDGDPELLRYLADNKLVPGQPVTLVDAAPFEGPVTVHVGGRDVAVAYGLAARIGVSS